MASDPMALYDLFVRGEQVARVPLALMAETVTPLTLGLDTPLALGASQLLAALSIADQWPKNEWAIGDRGQMVIGCRLVPVDVKLELLGAAVKLLEVAAGAFEDNPGAESWLRRYAKFKTDVQEKLINAGRASVSTV